MVNAGTKGAVSAAGQHLELAPQLIQPYAAGGVAKQVNGKCWDKGCSGAFSQHLPFTCLSTPTAVCGCVTCGASYRCWPAAKTAPFVPTFIIYLFSNPNSSVWLCQLWCQLQVLTSSGNCTLCPSIYHLPVYQPQQQCVAVWAVVPATGVDQQRKLHPLSQHLPFTCLATPPAAYWCQLQVLTGSENCTLCPNIYHLPV
jgi:hypothetical protein